MRAPPVLARVRRRVEVESRHRGDAAVVDEEGRLLASCGDPSRPIFLRSAAKPFQAFVCWKPGEPGRFRLSARDVALICASHGGEPRHVRTAQRLLDRGGFGAGDLVCGPDLPSHKPSAAPFSPAESAADAADPESPVVAASADSAPGFVRGFGGKRAAGPACPGSRIVLPRQRRAREEVRAPPSGPRADGPKTTPARQARLTQAGVRTGPSPFAKK